MTGEFDAGTPTLRVKVYERGHLVAAVLCESADEAAGVCAQWEDREGVESDLEDLSVRHGAFDVLAPEEDDTVPEDEYRS